LPGCRGKFGYVSGYFTRHLSLLPILALGENQDKGKPAGGAFDRAHANPVVTFVQDIMAMGPAIHKPIYGNLRGSSAGLSVSLNILAGRQISCHAPRN
jgi:hypothetical protein